QLRLHVGAGHGDDAVALELERRPHVLALQRRRAGRIADQYIGQTERPAVHRPRGRKALVPETDAPGPILHRGLETRFHDFDHFRALPDQNRWAGSSLSTQALYCATENFWYSTTLYW